MQSGIYTATSGLLTTIRDINVKSNNISNLSTSGYKADRLVTSSFARNLAYRQDLRVLGDKKLLGDVTRGKKALELDTDFSQGSLELTERTLDFALSGDGFFTFQKFNDDTNIYYSRNGQFQIDAEGYLINGNGDYALDDQMLPMYVGRYDFISDEYGNLTAANDVYLGKLGIFCPDEPDLLMKDGEGEFKPVNAGDTLETHDFQGKVMQKYTERSNTDMASQMAGLISASRSYQYMTQIIKTIDSIVGKSISEVGRP